MTKLKFNIAHQVPGRVRMRIPAGKGNLELLQQTADTFAAIPGVERITINPATGSLVMHYDVDHHNEFYGHFQRHASTGRGAPSTELDDLAQRIEQEAEFLARHSESARAIVDFFKKCDRDLRLATNNSVDLKIALALGLIGFTLFEVGATAATPVWVTLTLFTLNHVVEMHAKQVPVGATPVIVKN